MASKDYLRLCEEAQRKKLKLAKKQEQQIKQIYNDMYKNLSKKLKKVNSGTLTERYLQELQKELAKEIKSIHNKVEKIVKKNIYTSINLANNVQLDFFMQINEQHSLNMKDTFSSMFSKIPKAAMDEILYGTAYKDRKGLSERIWQYTKKFDKDIDYIISEGIANKKSTYEIAKDLEKYVNPNAAKDWDWKRVYPNSSKKVDYNAQRLARTAVNHAFQQAQKRSCEKNPYVEGIRWVSAGIHGRTCQLCKDRDGQLFKIKDVPLDHPNGLCTTIPDIPMSLEEIGTELRAWIDGASNLKLDKWFDEYGEDFL
ncbi:phage minor head protein [Romboutsia sp. 1001216sp1]|uniref:phage minor head protein n=1 Tax=Romboutsia sp. 1001216sp1 TaxID=2986997 RepID=UPI00233123C5|nr:phage minor head protein [Romboutsia sp. 1001216sp1]MDB8805023.1 phage minor head protein [Romboutsia sp. 1001216sp1]MDB8808013.1 phage minor head protein [Romboutsia sp. 1001216sp1]MDB8810668.1 phage minor head protein [Romboutsia sp. 1001216sp1]MDB8816388.1 phage minor head protein [Romboutsia sp. 1001216sp1]MDB8818659.1 phage minor head protein [Romboutsia sp. 1001216sp1]